MIFSMELQYTTDYDLEYKKLIRNSFMVGFALSWVRYYSALQRTSNITVFNVITNLDNFIITLFSWNCTSVSSRSKLLT